MRMTSIRPFFGLSRVNRFNAAKNEHRRCNRIERRT